MGFFLIFLTLVFVFYGIIKNSNPVLINNDIIYDKKDKNDYEDKIKINNFIINDNEINNKNKEEKEEEDDEK